MKKFLLSIATVALLAFCLVDATAQIKTPSASPSSTVTQALGLSTVTIEYSRPSVKKRAIFGDLVPFGKKWRLGANSATKITFTDDVTVNGTALKAGTYAVLATPSASSWAMEFHTHESGSWSSYKEKTPIATVTAKTSALPFSLETFLISMDNITSSTADLEFMWDKTIATLQIETEVDAIVMASIDKVLAGPTAGDYYNAGSYYFDSGKDLNKALAWVQKATSGDSPKFWQVRRESQILAAMKKYPAAIAAAKKSLELATTAGNADYVKMNTESIAKWMKM